jgi:small nuclear ribonucleoprotein (snRNP)-like protein
MAFLQLFRTLEGKKLVMELKNDIILQGTLQSVDQFHNFRLIDLQVLNCGNCPQLYTLSTALIRAARVRYVQLPKEEVDLELLHDATRRHNQGSQ